MPSTQTYFAYIVTNFNRSVFYIGCTNHIVRRVIEHQHEIGSKFTRRYKLKYLIYFEEYQYVQDAIARKKQLKRWGRPKKLVLIKKLNPKLKDLSKELFEIYEIDEKERKEIAKDLKERYK